jgi:hypothetical protein
MMVIPSESRRIPRRYRKACATGFLDFARNDRRSQDAQNRIPPLALFTVIPSVIRGTPRMSALSLRIE